jgi:hypothetical protein
VDAAGPLILASVLAAGAIVAPVPRARAAAMLGALVLTAAIAVAHVRHSEQLAALGDHRGPAAAGALAVAALVAGLAVLFDRRPGWLVPVAVLALPVRVPIAAGTSTTSLLAGLYVVVAAGVLAHALPRLARRPRDERRRSAGVVEWALSASLALYAVRAAGSPGLDRAVEAAALAFIPGALLFVLVSRVAWTTRLTRACLATAAALALVLVAAGYVEYAGRRLLLHPAVVALHQAGDYFRVQSLFFDPGLYGRFLVVVIVVVAAALVWTRRAGWAVLAIAVLAALWGGLLLTFSETSFAALPAGLAVLGALRFGVRPALALSVVAVALAAAAVALAPTAVDLDLGGSRASDQVLGDRYDLAAGGVRLWREDLVAGRGSGSFVAEYRGAERTSARRAQAAARTTPVTVAAENGLLGLGVYLVLVVAALARLLRGAREAPERAAIGAAFAALLAHTLLYGAFLADPLTWLLLAMGTGMVRRAPRARRSPAAERAPAAGEREAVLV